MRMKLSLLFTVIALALSAMSAQAQTTLNTVPEGVVTISLPPAPSTTYVSLPLTADPSYRGIVSSVIPVTSTTIAVDDSPAPWTGINLANLYFVKFLSGAEMGRVVLVTSNTASSLTLDTSDNSTGQVVNLTTSGFTVAAGDSFEVFPADTLGSVFGEYPTQAGTWTGTTTAVTLSAANPSIMVGATVTGTGIAAGTTVSAISGTSLTLSTSTTASGNGVTLSFTGAVQLFLNGAGDYLDADVVSFYNPSMFKFQSYYFNTTAGHWELKTSSANANNTILYPYGALTIFRESGATALSFPVIGRIAEVPVLTKVGTNNAAYGSSGYPVDLTLSQINLGANWQTASDYLDADILSVYTPSAFKFVSYYQLPSSTSWHTKSGSTDVSNSVTIHAGDVITLFQTNTVSGAQSFLSPAMPYTFPTNTPF